MMLKVDNILCKKLCLLYSTDFIIHYPNSLYLFLFWVEYFPRKFFIPLFKIAVARDT